MIPYPKTPNIYRRDPEDMSRLLEGEHTSDEIAYLADCEWEWTEKVDGTNIRVGWDGQTVLFGGRTDRAQIPAHLFEFLQRTFTEDALFEAFPDVVPPETDADVGGPAPVTLYGEGYGPKIQKGGGLYRDDPGLILFVVRVGRWWLRREAVDDVAAKMGIPSVPVVGRGPLGEAVERVRSGILSQVAARERDAEGLVCTPAVPLLDRAGRRIICKVKARDFR